MTEICMQGGIHPDYTLEDYGRWLKLVKQVAPHVHLHAYSPMEVHYMCERSGRRPRGGVRVPARVRARARLRAPPPRCSTTASASASRRTSCRSGAGWRSSRPRTARGLRSTVTVMFGHIEEPWELAEHMRVVRELQERTGGFTEFVPLSFIPFHTLLGRTHGIEEISREENLKHTAVFRLALGETVTNLQASWVKMGLDAATRGLRWGVNDLGGTLMEESISRMAGCRHGVRLEPEQLIEAARARRAPARPARHALQHPRDLLGLAMRAMVADRRRRRWRRAAASCATCPCPSRLPGRCWCESAPAACAGRTCTSSRASCRIRGCRWCPAIRSWERSSGWGRACGTSRSGARVGVPWLGGTDGTCPYCRARTGEPLRRADLHRLPARRRLRGVRGRRGRTSCFRCPTDYPDLQAAPLLCAGLIGYRALRLTEVEALDGPPRLGLYGFGASAHIVIQVARHLGHEVYVVTRGEARRAARARLGAAWAGGAGRAAAGGARQRDHLRAGGRARPARSRAVRKGGVVVCAGST